MSDLKKTVTIQVKVDPRIADLVYFAKYLRKNHDVVTMNDEQLINAAESFWDMQHGED